MLQHRASSRVGRSGALILLALLACTDGKPAEQSGAETAGAEAGAEEVLVRLQHALPRYAKARGMAHDPLEQQVQMAYGFMRRGQFDDARGLLQQVIDENPRNAPATYLLGCTWYRQQQYAAARPYFEKTLEGEPSFAGCESVFYRYGRCLYQLGDVAGSRSALLGYLELDPGEGNALFLLGRLDMEEGLLEAAIVRLKEAMVAFAVDEQPGRSMARHIAKCHARLGDVYLQQGKLAEARDALQEAVGIFPAHYEAHFMLSRVLTRLGEKDAAQRALEQFEMRKQQAGR